MSVGIFDDVASLDFKTPFDELTELRTVLTNQEIAELTGLRRETISRARPDSRFQRRTEEALRDLFLVVTQMKSVVGEDVGQLAPVLRRPQVEFAGRSIADLLREGKVEVILESLFAGPEKRVERPATPRLDHEAMAQLAPWREPSETDLVRDPALDARVAAVLDADPELQAKLEAVEGALIAHFGTGTEIERKVVSEFYDDPEGSDELYLRLRNDVPFDANIDRLADFLREEEDLVAPVLPRLTIGFLG